MSALTEHLTDHVAKLYKIVDGALSACEREHRPEQRERNQRFWHGYRQCLDDMSHFITTELTQK